VKRKATTKKRVALSEKPRSPPSSMYKFTLKVK
jgi:hypothetical protein